LTLKIIAKSIFGMDKQTARNNQMGRGGRERGVFKELSPYLGFIQQKLASQPSQEY
jgi:hypothetical protein